MEFSDVTIVLIGVIVIGLVSLYFGKDDMAMAIIGGLLGYMAKDHITSTALNNSPVKEYEEGLNQEYTTGDDDGS